MSQDIQDGQLPNGELPAKIRNQAMWMHLAGVGAVLFGFVIYWFSLLIPFIAWRTTRKRHPFIDESGRNVMNFHLTIAIYSTIFWLVMGLIWYSSCSALYQVSPYQFNQRTVGSNPNYLIFNISSIAIAVFAVLQPLFSLILSIFGAVKAKRGHVYRYPFAIQFFKPPQ
jgi:uncharacterized protein